MQKPGNFLCRGYSRAVCISTQQQFAKHIESLRRYTAATVYTPIMDPVTIILHRVAQKSKPLWRIEPVSDRIGQGHLLRHMSKKWARTDNEMCDWGDIRTSSTPAPDKMRWPSTSSIKDSSRRCCRLADSHGT